MNMKADRGEMAGGGENDNPLSFIENSPPLKDIRAPITQCGNACVMGARNIYRFTNSGEKRWTCGRLACGSSSKGRRLFPAVKSSVRTALFSAVREACKRIIGLALCGNSDD